MVEYQHESPFRFSLRSLLLLAVAFSIQFLLFTRFPSSIVLSSSIGACVGLLFRRDQLARILFASLVAFMFLSYPFVFDQGMLPSPVEYVTVVGVASFLAAILFWPVDKATDHKTMRPRLIGFVSNVRTRRTLWLISFLGVACFAFSRTLPDWGLGIDWGLFSPNGYIAFLGSILAYSLSLTFGAFVFLRIGQSRLNVNWVMPILIYSVLYLVIVLLVVRSIGLQLASVRVRDHLNSVLFAIAIPGIIDISDRIFDGIAQSRYWRLTSFMR